MNYTEQKVLETIDKYKMLKSGDRVICAVSGGFDSMAMLNILMNLRNLRNFTVEAVHLNHKFRIDADDDEQYVCDFCKKHSIPFHSKRINVSEYAKEHKLSFETAGRNLRYDFFKEVAKGDMIATAHNANDNAESVIMHLLRGAGIKGLCGISPKNDNIIRPIIELTREDVEKYCHENALNPRTDSTNSSDDYFRNDVRHNLMPEIYKRSSLNVISNLSLIATEENDYFDNKVKDIILNSFEDNSIKVKIFNEFHKSVKRRLIKEFMKNATFTQIEAVINMCEKMYGGKQIQLTGGIVKLENGRVYFYER